MRKHSFRLLISFTGCLLAVTPAYADGGISSLGGLLDMIVLFIGAIGLFIIALMFAAISSRKNKTRSNVGIKIIIGISVAYVPLALFFFVMSQESQFVMVPAVTGGCIIALLCVYMFRFGNQASDSRT